MKKALNIFLIIVAALVVFTACNKINDLPYNGNGNAVVLSASATTVTPARADSTKNLLTLSWTSPNYATDTANYKYIIEIDSTGKNFAHKTTREVVSNRSASFTARDLNAIALGYNGIIGTPVSLDMRVVSSYKNNNERYTSNAVKVTITPYADPSVLTTQKTTVVTSIGTSNQPSNTFSWSNAFPGYTGDVTYTLEYDTSKNFTSLKAMVIGKNVQSKSLTEGEMNTTAIAAGIAAGATGNVNYRIKATTASGQVAYSNSVVINIKTYIVALYLVGGSSPAGWTPSAATPLIPDPLFPGAFYTYATLTVAGSGIKFLAENTDWNTPTQVIYGDVADPNTGNLTSAGGGQNIAVPADGIYRITVDLANMKYYLQKGAPGGVALVGDFQNWTLPSNLKMANPKPNMFIAITNMTQGDKFKFHDGNDWSNSSLTGSKWYDDKGNGALIKNGPGSGDNITWSGTTGNVRAIFDYTDINNPTYSLTEANGMWVIGSATPGDWINDVNQTDAQRPPLTYQGNGVWKGTVTLNAGDIKFIVKKGDWGFSYGGSNGNLIYKNGPNITVAAGTYTIIVNEYTQTYTIQ